MRRPTKEQVDACMAQVFAEVGELYKGPSAGQFILAAEVQALRSIVSRAIEVCERAQGLEEDLFTAEALEILRGGE